MRLSRHRRLLAAVFAAGAAALFLAATSHHTKGVRVLVAARDLPAGTTLNRSNVTARLFPADAVPSGPVRRAEGRVLSGPVRRGEPLTDARLRSGGLLNQGLLNGGLLNGGSLLDPKGPLGSGGALGSGGSAGTGAAPRTGGTGTSTGAVATPVRLADAAVVRLLHVGDRVDVLAARVDAPSPARTITPAVPIIAVPKPDPDTDEGALVVVATTRDQASLLARAAVDSRLSVTILGGPP